MSTNASLKGKLRTIKGSLTRFSNYIKQIKDKSVSDINFIALETRFETSKKLLERFEEVQLEIEQNDESFDDNSESYLAEREEFENLFYESISNAVTIMKGETSNVCDNKVSSSFDIYNANTVNNIKLPALKLPTFDGNYNQYLFFRDTFNSVIHNNTVLSNIQKFHYLRLSLQGDAAEVIKSLEVSEGNYLVAWNLLQERYENKQLLINNHIKALFNLPSATRESLHGIRQVLDGLQINLRALEALELPTKHWDALLIFLITSKLDNITLRQWESENTENKLQTLDNLITFLKKRCYLLESLELNFDKLPKGELKGKSRSLTTSSNINCLLCKKNHSLYTCPEFLLLQPIDRLKEAKRLRVCVNCLRPNHATKDCRSEGCRKCSKFHHTLLHFDTSNRLAMSKQNKNEKFACTAYSNSEQDPQQPSTSSINTFSQRNSHVLLSTAIVTVYDKFNKPHNCRVLLDNGSQSNFISERLCRILKLQKSKIDFSVQGINHTFTNVGFRVFVKVKSQASEFKTTLACFVLPEITGNIPSFTLNKCCFTIPHSIKLADCTFNKSAPVDILIGADTFWELLSVGQIKTGTGPILQKTKLGWIISGPTASVGYTQTVKTFFTNSLNKDNELQRSLTKFWELEELKPNKILSTEQSQCESHFKHTTFRNNEGRFVVSLPLKGTVTQLGDSKQNALRRFYKLETKLNSDPNLKSQYVEFMNEYLRLGHMSLCKDQHSNEGFFLPHHCVIKIASLTSKYRVVFDASAKSSSGFSLNDILMTGPTIQDDLFSILLRFRKHAVVLGGDIEKMYRQVLICQDQRQLQKIIWRNNRNERLLVYELNTVTYGMASAAFLAIRALHEVAHLNSKGEPHISSLILEDFYVDDLLTGGDSIEEMKSIQREIYNTLLRYGFKLRKWSSNKAELQATGSDSGAEVCVIGQNEPNKTLGLLWNSRADVLSYSIKKPEVNKVTKRQILSTIAQIFDPLGLLSPVTITSKIILQRLWQLNISWDESLPMDLHTKWLKYRLDIFELNNLQIPRRVICDSHVSTELHGFSDSSENAYGACIYLRSTDKLGKFHSNLLCAKTRVAPLKQITIPKLELCGAYLLAELMNKVKCSSRLDILRVVYWCDSTIVLAWINTSPHLLKPFVANRVAQIQNLSKPNSWRYINTKENPSDLLSRGISPKTLIGCNLWFHGPSWLIKAESQWPLKSTQEYIKLENIPEMRSKIVTLTVKNVNFDILDKYSSFTKLQHVVAYILRFKENSLQPRCQRTFGALTPCELDESLNLLLRLVQQYYFAEDYDCLLKYNSVRPHSKLLCLNPFLNENKIILVGGRLSNSNFSSNKKHPAILPQKCHFTNLIIKHEHVRLLHAGPTSVLASVRDRFWPINGRNVTRKIVRDCSVCFKFNARPESYLMGDLPKVRVTPSRPFLNCGIDYAGPFLLRDRRTKNYKLVKAYVCLFVCLVTKAIHLELVGDLSTESFLASLRRFIARRGHCKEIISDNATNFTGATAEINRFVKENSFKIASNLSDQGIKWSFIPPRAPHFGGIWEAGVKSLKYHLKRVIGDAHLTYEEFVTVLTQIESCLNSRPLCPLSNHPNDPNPLTPAHFLIGEALTALPDHNWSETKENRLSRFQRLQQITQHFWSRWSKEYISGLQQRYKWKSNQRQLLKPGLLVVVKEDGLPPLKWKMGRISELFPGQDGVVRAVSVRTSTGIIKRPTVKLCVLPNQPIDKKK